VHELGTRMAENLKATLDEFFREADEDEAALRPARVAGGT